MQQNKSNLGPESARIRVLLDSVARRIAAGEVIDRPYSVVRELLDNAIDADSRNIRLEITNGGMDSIICTDDGIGMSYEDLKLSILPHATSKIRDFDDLYRLSTLGFRGEALSSVSACSRLEILSRSKETDQAWRLKVHGGKTLELKEDHGSPGTRVNVEDLFYSLPGRKKFLKSSGAEGNLCTSAFLEKSIPFPEIEFRYFNNGKLKTFLPAGDLKNRVCASYPRILNSDLVNIWETENGPYGFKIAGASPSLYRKDRRYIQIYVNKRRINDFSLTQAVEYGYNEYLPGGCFPLAFVFITTPPEIVDFNIHPSKKEVRFRDRNTLHRALVGAVKEGLSGYSRGASITSFIEDKPQYFSEPSFSKKSYDRRSSLDPFFSSGSSISEKSGFNRKYTDRVTQPSSGYYPDNTNKTDRISPVDIKPNLEPIPPCNDVGAASDTEESDRSMENSNRLPIRYLGQIMNLFLVVERGDSLFLIDQHAAHERIIYNRFLSDPGGKQELLVPIIFELSGGNEVLLEDNLQNLKESGFDFERISEGKWQLQAIPSRYEGMEDIISEFLNNPRGDYSLLEKELNHTASCRKAVKDGDILDDLSAVKLAEETFSLPQPRCPHGRPVWFELTRDELYRLVGRSI